MPELNWKRVYAMGLGDEDFAGKCQRAAALGATHVEVGELPEKPRHEKTDPGDPYLEYSFLVGTLFRFIVDDEVRVMTPADYEARTFKVLKERCAVLRRHGLRGRMWLLEPHAWPEPVFAAHPDWRGPRVDYPPRARRPYFAPCIDHPEVLALYQRTIRRLCTECPELELFRLTINDSGAGVCWSQHLYSGQNGPAACRHRSMGKRMHDFFQAWIDGAKEAGVDIRIWTSPRGFSDAQAEEARLRSQEQGCILPLPGGFPDAHAGIGSPSPLVGIADPVGYLNQLARTVDKPDVHLGFHSELDWQLVECFTKRPATSLTEKQRCLAELAAQLAGDARCNDVLEVWETVHQALGHVEYLPWRGLLFTHGLLSKRWLNRPFTVAPCSLREDELDYWRQFLFEAGGEREVHNMLNIHAIQVVDGVSHARDVRTFCQQGVSDCAKAAAGYEALAESPGAGLFLHQAALCRALAHCYRSVGNAVLFQAMVDAAESKPPAPALHALERDLLTEIYRDEILNARQFADLLDNASQPLVKQAASPEAEDTYLLSPALPEQLRRKAAIMSARWRDLEQLMPYPLQWPTSDPEERSTPRDHSC